MWQADSSGAVEAWHVYTRCLCKVAITLPVPRFLLFSSPCLQIWFKMELARNFFFLLFSPPKPGSTKSPMYDWYITRHRCCHFKWTMELKKTLEILRLAAGASLKFPSLCLKKYSGLGATSDCLFIYSACGRTKSRVSRLGCCLGSICRPLWYFTYLRHHGGLTGNWFGQKKRGRPTGITLLQMEVLNSWVADEISSRARDVVCQNSSSFPRPVLISTFENFKIQ